MSNRWPIKLRRIEYIRIPCFDNLPHFNDLSIAFSSLQLMFVPIIMKKLISVRKDYNNFLENNGVNN